MAASAHVTSVPDWLRPFHQDDFRGFFTWDAELTERLDRRLYHACHVDEARTILAEKQLGLRSQWSLEHPTFKKRTVLGVWCGLNHYANGNRYGPVLFSFPLTGLNGRTFMVFRREGADRNRYWFVQYEAGFPIFTHDDDPDRRVKPSSYFDDGKKGALWLKKGAIYEIVLTHPVKLKGSRVEGTNHPPKCIPGKCQGVDAKGAEAVVNDLARELVEAHLAEDRSIQRLLRRFPALAGMTIKLPEERS